MMEEIRRDIHIEGTNVGVGVCLECIGGYKVHFDNAENVANEVPPPAMFWGITLAPSWQQQQLRTPQGMQVLTACVAVPCCMNHLGVKQASPEQRAANSGLIIPGVSG